MSRDLSYPSTVANATGATDICNLWYNHYKTLFSSVGYDSHTVEGILDNVSRPNIHDIRCSLSLSIFFIVLPFLGELNFLY